MSTHCQPIYEFKRLDIPYKKESAATGFNFRYASKYSFNGIDFRTLVKAYGIQFLINVNGKAGRFNIIPLMNTLGTGIGLMSFSVILGDLAMRYFVRLKPEEIARL